MASESSYYVPESSWYPVVTATAMGLLAIGGVWRCRARPACRW